MSTEREYQPHKLIVPALFTGHTALEDLEYTVGATFGPIDSSSGTIPFNFTNYYDAELGTPIQRVLFSIRGLVDPGDLARLKHAAMEAETRSARSDGRRTINLDPGLLSLSRVILATTKASAHRIPIGTSIHAEITLLFRRGAFTPLEWTYPDFRSARYQEWLLSVRQRYHDELRMIDGERAWRL